jgi:two-component system chemotaxis sensor kinase CheA
MGTKDDETLQVYIEESLDHLSGIENDLLAIEKAGANIDKDLVNTVFRAAHSIKGGAGFVGLTNIKELSHKMESVLGMIRNRELVPNAENINFLLLASDALKNLIINVHESDEIDISKHMEALSAITEAGPSQEKTDPLPEQTSELADISLPGGKTLLSVPKDALSNAGQEGKSLYLIEIDLKHDVHMKDKTAQKLLDEVQSYGTVLGSIAGDDPGSILKNNGPLDRTPFLILFACVLEPDDIAALFEIEREYIHKVSDDLMASPMAQSPPVEALPGQVPPTPK